MLPVTSQIAPNFTTSQSSGPKTPKDPDWQAFEFETGVFALHVPSATIFATEKAVYEHIKGYQPSKEVAAALHDYAASINIAPRQIPEVAIKAISLHMAQDCNLRCTYCFAGEGDYGKRSKMDFETATSAISFFAKQSDRLHIIFFGGEPSLNFAVIKEVVTWCEAYTAKHGCQFTFAMTSNGVLLQTPHFDWLKAKGVALTISYDGKHLHGLQRLNKNKLSNSEQLVRQKLERFGHTLATLKSFTLRTTYERRNLMALKTALFDTINSYNYRVMMAHHAASEHDLKLDQDDITLIESIYDEIISTLIAEKRFETILRFENIARHLRHIKGAATNLPACGAGISYLSVSTNGEFYLCHRMNEDAQEQVGSLTQGLQTDKLQAVANFRSASQDPCKSCWMREWCAGGCMHENKLASEDKFSIDPIYCQLQAIEIKQALRVYTHMLSECPDILETA